VPVRATAVAVGGRAGSGLLRPLLWALVVVAIVVALTALLGGIRELVLMTSPEVQRAQVQTRVAEEQHRTAELQRETATIRAQRKAEAPWESVMVGAEHMALLALLIAVPVALVAAFAGAVLLFRRHVSLPTRDGRVPLVALDQDMSREALIHYQLRVLSRGASYEALPQRPRSQFSSVPRIEAGRQQLTELVEPDDC
jgi:uncharacterized membrane protein